jgi:hypothetical protein
MFSCFFAGIWTYNYKRMEGNWTGLEWNGLDGLEPRGNEGK